MVSICRAKFVCMDFDRWLCLYFGIGSYKFGLILHYWGVRIMFWRWHLCAHWPSLKAAERRATSPNNARDAIDECRGCLYDGECVYPRPCVVNGKSCRSTAPVA
jgi:hypothetical protein